MKPGTLNYDSPVFFDLETSGTDINKHEIIQIGAVHAESGDCFEAKLKFNKGKADSKALEMNSYDEALWEKYALFPQRGLTEFAKFLSGHANLPRESKRGSRYRVVSLIGYNSCGFDMPLLWSSMRKHGIFCPADPRGFDLMQLFLWSYPGSGNYTLAEAQRVFGVDDEKNGHDALADAKSCLGLCRILLAEMFNEDALPAWVLK